MVIDTNVYSALDSGNEVAVAALKLAEQLYVPIVVVAELRFGFKNGSNLQQNEAKLVKFLSQSFVETLYVTDKTAEIYAELALHCRKSGRALSQNDLWIAALALENELPFVSFDNDFAVLEQHFGEKLNVLQPVA